jgi:hypothetical protein
MKMRVRRYDSLPHIYMAYAMRCKFAIETFRSIRAPWVEQCIELELMLRDEVDDGTK